jgi:hypothetical protein
MTDEHAGRVIVRALLTDHPVSVLSPGADTRFVTVLLESFLDACAHGEADPLLLPEGDQHLLNDFYDSTDTNRFELSVLNEAGRRQSPGPGFSQDVVLGMIGDMVQRSIESVKDRPYETSDGFYFA